MNPASALDLILELWQQLRQARQEADAAQQRIAELQAEKAEQNGSPKMAKTTMAANAADLA